MTLPDPTLAAESVLDPSLRDLILYRCGAHDGATVADLLDMADQADRGLEQIEPAMERYGEHLRASVLPVVPAEMPDDLVDLALTRAIHTAMLVYVLAGQPLVEDAVRDLAAQIVRGMTAPVTA